MSEINQPEAELARIEVVLLGDGQEAVRSEFAFEHPTAAQRAALVRHAATLLRVHEQRLLSASQKSLAAFIGLAPFDGTVESVALEGEHAPCMIVRFRANTYPGRRFAWRSPVWPAHDPRGEYGTPEDRAGLLSTHLEEAINDIENGSLTPDDDGVEWIIWEH